MFYYSAYNSNSNHASTMHAVQRRGKHDYLGQISAPAERQALLLWTTVDDGVFPRRLNANTGKTVLVTLCIQVEWLFYIMVSGVKVETVTRNCDESDADSIESTGARPTLLQMMGTGALRVRISWSEFIYF